MTRFELSYVEVGALVWLSSEPIDERAIREVECLRSLYDRERADAVLAGPWTFVERCTVFGIPCKHGAAMRLRSTVAEPHEVPAVVLVHRMDVLLQSPDQTRLEREAWSRKSSKSSERRLAIVSAPLAPEPARCTPRPRAPWADNVDVGALYLQQEPGGTYRASLLVNPPGGGKSSPVATACGLAAEEVAEQLALMVRRLAARAVTVTGTGGAQRSDVPLAVTITATAAEDP